ncbi:MAG: transketolase [Alphaproteobacteria bacterium]
MTALAAAPTGTPSATHTEMANAVRALAMDAVEKAKSGHPGMPMGMADVATVLFTRHLKFDPADPAWPDRDRFVLSNGHGSMLLYAVLYLTGYDDMTLDQLESFRQLGSRTPGHPEHELAAGVETTTGPLGQGLANAVGMALAERMLAARYGDDIVDHYTYVFCGDGCLMEGISHEAVSLAGHLRLDRLIVLFDDNGISIDGPTELAVSDDQLARFAACGWSVERIDGHDPAAVDGAISRSKESGRPSLIACRTVIGYGAPHKAGSAAVHGAALGEDEVAAARIELGWPHAPFEVPDGVLAAWREAGSRGAAARVAWQERLAAKPAELRSEFGRTQAGALPKGFGDAVAALKRKLAEERPNWATRKASQEVLEVLTAVVPELVGGSADLTGSNNTRTAATPRLTADDYGGRYIHYGVREHGMAGAMSGLALHGGLIPYGGTFLTFTDYCRPAIRLAAMMGVRVVYVMTHDSIGLGEDGPTHQPVEHLAALRAIPNLRVLRPADAIETAECWQVALEHAGGPSVIALTRQGVPPARGERDGENLCARGGYVIAKSDGRRAASILASGSEVAIALEARARLAAEGFAVAVVSLPCWEIFDAQPDDYRRDVLGSAPRVAVEAAQPFGWTRYVDGEDAVVGMTTFGASAPYKALYEHFGITADRVAAKVRERLG